jgi:hypothetical protein
MSFKSNINNSYNSNINKTTVIYSYKYYSVNHFINFMSNTFVKKTKLPFISIGLFIIVIVLNSIQYVANDRNYLQDLIKNSVSDAPDTTSFQNVLLYIFDLIGINAISVAFYQSVLFFILAYTCLSLIEMNIGHIKLIFFLIVLLMFQFFEGGFISAICENNLYGATSVGNSPYCCGSFVLWAAVGFTLFIIQKHTTDFYKKLYAWFVICCVLIGCILNEITIDDQPNTNQKICKMFFWHTTNYLLGLYCGFAFAN